MHRQEQRANASPPKQTPRFEVRAYNRIQEILLNQADSAIQLNTKVFLYRRPTEHRTKARVQWAFVRRKEAAGL